MNALMIFLASLSTGVLFSLPRASLLTASAVAVGGYLMNSSMLGLGVTQQEAAFAASFAVSMLAELLAKFLKVPALVLAIPGIIPLVPGSTAYRATTYLVANEQLLGGETAMTASLTAVGIASGLLLASALSRRVIKPMLARLGSGEQGDQSARELDSSNDPDIVAPGADAVTKGAGDEVRPDD